MNAIVPFITEARRRFHAALLQYVLRTDAQGVPSNADKHSKISVRIAHAVIEKIGSEALGSRLTGQMSGNQFEEICKAYLEETFMPLKHLRPGQWEISKGVVGGRLGIAHFEQYDHLAVLDEAARSNPELAAALGLDYLIKPDIVIIRHPEEDSRINQEQFLVDDGCARLTSLRMVNGAKSSLHASVSCKWTIRSDRSQNARSEALNLVRNRKGRLPHIVVVTAEPTPNRIASIALGTGDIDCVYHFALTELIASVNELGFEDAAETLQTMIEGKRLRDISDLPLDLVI